MNEKFFRRIFGLENFHQTNSQKIQKPNSFSSPDSCFSQKLSEGRTENSDRSGQTKAVKVESAENGYLKASTRGRRNKNKLEYQGPKTPLTTTSFSTDPKISSPEEKKTKTWIFTSVIRQGTRSKCSSNPSNPTGSKQEAFTDCSDLLQDLNDVPLVPVSKSSAKKIFAPLIGDEEASPDLIRTPSLSSSMSSSSADSTPSGLVHPTKILKTIQSQVLFQPPKKKKTIIPRVFQMNEHSKSINSDSKSESENGERNILPEIILSYPTDEDDYCTISPFSFDLICPYTENSASQMKYLRVPTAPPRKTQGNLPKRRQWPHLSGPWLRPAETRSFRISQSTEESDSNQLVWEDGCRLSDGQVVGWTRKFEGLMQQYYFQLRLQKAFKKFQNTTHAFSQSQKLYEPVNSFPPPRLPSDEEIIQRQLLVEHELNATRDSNLHKSIQRIRPVNSPKLAQKQSEDQAGQLY